MILTLNYIEHIRIPLPHDKNTQMKSLLQGTTESFKDSLLFKFLYTKLYFLLIFKSNLHITNICLPFSLERL